MFQVQLILPRIHATSSTQQFPSVSLEQYQQEHQQDEFKLKHEQRSAESDAVGPVQ